MIASEGGTPKQNYFHQDFLSQNHHGLPEDSKIRVIDKLIPLIQLEESFSRCENLKR